MEISEEELPEVVRKNLNPGEKALHVLKKRKSLEAKPKRLVITNRGIMLVDEKIFGRYELSTVPYEKLERVTFKSGLISSEFAIEKEDGEILELSWLGKEESKKAIETIRDLLNKKAVEPVSIEKDKGLKSEKWVLTKPEETVGRYVSLGESKRSRDAFKRKGVAAEQAKTGKEKDPAEKLRDLKSLFEEGIISKEEYEAKRQKYLDKL
ncbi:hypothetical protein AKJ37_00025 [candidate division MSBL1 archaeon SCGC-AAA259I09]|uniref:YokE-like PH domain-containing protein n=2 Tax=candidate division MSBL1 TaxID=215777 RepID=A0A133UVZ6_9EURY|nr:hypothetical protein AKJ36_02640 [candidate division MSBL1 archaeon SCGC-AAA259I07]KXA98391.1 hypothetical protein AKJ37_00025 [candidate division MSBL1 archaeon SCGC-AAA259I09]